jgi:hypothetical protein
MRSGFDDQVYDRSEASNQRALVHCRMRKILTTARRFRLCGANGAPRNHAVTYDNLNQPNIAENDGVSRRAEPRVSPPCAPLITGADQTRSKLHPRPSVVIHPARICVHLIRRHRATHCATTLAPSPRPAMMSIAGLVKNAPLSTRRCENCGRPANSELSGIVAAGADAAYCGSNCYWVSLDNIPLRCFPAYRR